MDFRLDEQQLELRDTVRRFCAARLGHDDLARREGRPVDRGTWRALAELGVFALLAGAEHGGLGLGFVAAAIVFEQLGAHLVGGPVLWTTLGAAYADRAAGGERLVGGVDLSVGGGDPLVVEHGGDLDALLVLGADGVFLHEGPTLPAFRSVAPLDPLTPVAHAAALPPGARVGDAYAAARLRREGTVLCAALQLGVADAALEASRAYALAREQFGVPIGSFQAVQHMLADMYVRTALARGAVYAAAAVLDDPAIGDPAIAGATAKVLAGEAALENARVAIQVHGGMGFTWEMLPGYLLKRAWLLEHAFGAADAHALALGVHIEELPA